MRLLVFGKTGQVARELARLPGGEMTFLGRAEAELTDPDACIDAIAAARPQAVINAAAFTDVDAAEDRRDTAFAVNATAPGAMARACAGRDIPFLQISTDYVFDGAGSLPFAPDAAAAPLNAYGASKLAGERLVREAGGRHLILRTSWVFSAHGRNFVTAMLALGRTRARLQVVADQIGGPTAAADIAGTLVRLSRAMLDGARGGTYHYAGRPATSWAGFARAIFAASGQPVQVCDIAASDWPARAPRPLNSRLDCATLTADFAITPPRWEPALKQVVAEVMK